MNTIYESGEYLSATETWHAEDSEWKAEQISEILAKNNLSPLMLAEIGCGAGEILKHLSNRDELSNTEFYGFDISPQAIELATKNTSKNLNFKLNSLEQIDLDLDVLMAIDVFEHVPDYMGFLETCQSKAKYKIYHIPLDIHVSSVLRNAFVKQRASIGHIHYFTAESAIATLEDTGHEILSYQFTNVGTGLFRKHPSLKRALANIPRYLISVISARLSARLFGGYSLLVLAK